MPKGIEAWALAFPVECYRRPIVSVFCFLRGRFDAPCGVGGALGVRAVGQTPGGTRRHGAGGAKICCRGFGAPFAAAPRGFASCLPVCSPCGAARKHCRARGSAETRCGCRRGGRDSVFGKPFCVGRLLCFEAFVNKKAAGLKKIGKNTEINIDKTVRKC